MTARTWLLLSWIVVGAALLVAHLVILVQVVRAEPERLPRPWRLLAVVPVAAPVLAWLGGARRSVYVWGALAALYLTLRLVEPLL